MGDTLMVVLGGLTIAGLATVRLWAGFAYVQFIDQLPEAERTRVMARNARALY